MFALALVTKGAAAQTPEAAPPAEPPAPAAPPPAEAAPPAAEPAAPTPPVAPQPAPEAAPAPAAPPPAAPEPATTPPPPPPAPAFPLAATGSIWSRYELRQRYEEHGLTHPRLHREGDYVVSRARLGLKVLPIDAGGDVKASAFFAPQAAYTWGEGTGATPTVSDHPVLAVYEAYASVGTSGYRLDAGRFAMNYGDALVIGDLGWNEAARAFNGVRLHLTPGDKPYFVDGFVTVIGEGRAISLDPVALDTYFWGLYAGLGPLLGEKLELDLYALGFSSAGHDAVPLTDPADPTMTAQGDQDPATELTLGVRTKGSFDPIDYRLEAGVQLGKRAVVPTFATPAPDARKRTAYQVDAEVGVTPVEGFRVAVEGLYASGDDAATTAKDEGYADLFPTGHKWLGLMDVLPQRTNVVSGVLHLKYQATKAWLLAVDGHYFGRIEPVGGRDGGMGAEIDANVGYAIGGGASVRGLYGVFLPNETFWENKSRSPEVADDALHFVEVQFGLEFK